MIGKERNDEPRISPPPVPGTYALVLRFSARAEIVVGRLGVLEARPGHYVYVGSALGPGGLAARVGRHLRSEKTVRWHVDYVRTAADLEEVWYVAGKSHRECRWASVLGELPGASVPMPGFGASDCGCPSHLVFFTLPPSLAGFRKKLHHQRIESLPVAEATDAMPAAASARRPSPGGTRR
jgi:Uri superfamily endonuclease